MKFCSKDFYVMLLPKEVDVSEPQNIYWPGELTPRDARALRLIHGETCRFLEYRFQHLRDTMHPVDYIHLHPEAIVYVTDLSAAVAAMDAELPFGVATHDTNGNPMAFYSYDPTRPRTKRLVQIWHRDKEPWRRYATSLN